MLRNAGVFQCKKCASEALLRPGRVLRLMQTLLCLPILFSAPR